MSRVSSTNPDDIEVVVVDIDTSGGDFDGVDTSSVFNLKQVNDRLAYVEVLEPEPISKEDYAWITSPYLEDEFEDKEENEPNPVRKFND